MTYGLLSGNVMLGSAHTLGFIVPFIIATAFILPVFSLIIKRKLFYDIYAIAVSLIALIATVMNLNLVLSFGAPIVYVFAGWPPPLGIIYEVDLYSAVLGVLTAAVMFLIVVYSTVYIRDGGHAWYYTLLLGLEAGLLGCLYTGDVFNLFVMLEVLSISAYALVAYYRGKHQAIEAAMKYAIFGAVATTIYFLAVIFIYASYGTLTMADIAFKGLVFTSNVFSGGLFGNIVVASITAIALALWAFTYKAALFPNHFWLPDAHPEAPTPVSAALSGLVVNVGVYAVARLLYTVFGLSKPIVLLRDAVLFTLLILGIMSGLIGALMMVVQRDVKRLLAYSTISHVGLMFMGLSLGFSTLSQDIINMGLTASLYHLINHSVGKALLFLVTGVFIGMAGSRDLDKLAGMGRYNKLAMAVLIIGFLQLMGVPPLGGFFSKLMLYSAFISANMPIPAVLVVVISAISVLGYVKVIDSLWFKQVRITRIAATPKLMTYVPLVLAIISILLGVINPRITEWLAYVIEHSLSPEGVKSYIDSFNLVVYNLLRHIGG